MVKYPKYIYMVHGNIHYFRNLLSYYEVSGIFNAIFRTTCGIITIFSLCSAVAFDPKTEKIEYDLGVHQKGTSYVFTGQLSCSHDGTLVSVAYADATYFFEFKEGTWQKLPKQEKGCPKRNVYSIQKNIPSRLGWGVTKFGKPVYCFDDQGEECFYIEDGQLHPSADKTSVTNKSKTLPTINNYNELISTALVNNPNKIQNEFVTARPYRILAISESEDKAIVSFDDVGIDLICFSDLSIYALTIHDYPCPGIAMKSGAEFLPNGILVKFAFDAEKTTCANNVVYQLFDEKGNFMVQIDDIAANTTVIGCHPLPKNWLVYGNGTRIVFAHLSEQK